MTLRHGFLRRFLVVSLTCSLVATPISALAAPPEGSLAGDFLSAQWSRHIGDAKAAAEFIDAALKRKPDQPDLIRQGIFAHLWIGDFDRADDLSRQLESYEPYDLFPILVRVTADVKRGRYESAQEQLKPLDVDSGPGRELILPFMKAWLAAGRDDLTQMQAEFKPFEQRQGLSVLRDWHLGLAQMMADNKDQAEASFASALKGLNAPSFRFTEIYAGFLRDADQDEKASQIIDQFAKGDPRNPLAVWLRDEETVTAPVKSAKDGLAEAFFDLAGIIRQEQGTETSVLLLRLSLALQPRAPVVQMLLADLLAEQNQAEGALAIYDQVSDRTPFGWQAEISAAEILAQTDRSEEAIEKLEQLADRHPDQFQAFLVLGHIHRAEQRYPEAIAAYDAAVARLGTPTAADWPLFYTRGIAHERSKQWQQAEADFLKALELQPDQPQVLNYLAYSWIEQGQNYTRAEEMLKKAVAERPDDGAIVDSLGWAYYRQGRFEQAVPLLERAVELVPGDPTVNDHLGDVYWQVGRRNEAMFQWRRALLFKPEPDQIPLIEKKLQSGLTPGEVSSPPSIPASGG